MKSIEERKLALISQINQLKIELINMKFQDHMQSLLRACTGRGGYVGLGRSDNQSQ